MGVTCSDEERNRIKKNISQENEMLHKALMIATEGNPKLIDYLEKCNLGIDLSTYKKNISHVIRDQKEEIDAINFYDVIVSISSIRDIIKGWNIKINKKINEKYKEGIKEKVLKIGVIGNSNKGKSFILSKLSKIKLPSGTSITTEGLSIKYPDLEGFENRRIVLLDSAGLETPVLKEDKENSKKIDEKKKKENEENRGSNKEKLAKNENIKVYEINNEKENIQNIIIEEGEKDGNEIFKEKSRDKVITELFLQNYIIHNSDILIVVLGLLTYSEQKILNRIKTELKRAKLNKTLYLIHNLMTYTTKKQVEYYIKDILLKSATFELEKQMKINTKETKMINESEAGVCYYEKENNTKIFHLIFANEDSEAGNYYNEYTLNFIESSYEKITDLKGFNILETIKERFKEVSKEIIENLEGEISFDKSKNLIKLINPKEIKLRRCYIDELGFSNLRANGFEPYYNYYRKGNEIIVRVEAPGNCEIESSIEYAGEYTVIKLFGNKNKDEEPIRLEDNIFNGRELGRFSLDIPLKTEAFLIKNGDPKFDKKNGLFILSYQLDKKKEKKKYIQDEKDKV